MMGKFQHPPIFDLAGCLEHGFYFSIYWESSSSQLTNSIIFRGVGLKHQAVMVKSHGFPGKIFPTNSLRPAMQEYVALAQIAVQPRLDAGRGKKIGPGNSSAASNGRSPPVNVYRLLWKMDHRNIFCLLKMVIFHSYVNIPTLLKMEFEGGESYWNFILKFHFCNHVFSMINIPHHSMSLASRWKLNTCA